LAPGTAAGSGSSREDLLVADKNDFGVRYSLAGQQDQIRVGSFDLSPPSLQAALPTAAELAQALQDSTDGNWDSSVDRSDCNQTKVCGTPPRQLATKVAKGSREDVDRFTSPRGLVSIGRVVT